MIQDSEVLTKFFRNKYIGGRYISYEDAYKGLPTDQQGDAKDTIDDLVKRGVLIPHKGGDCVSLNPKRIDEAKSILRDSGVDDFIIDRL